jgi:hypothetical protein
MKFLIMQFVNMMSYNKLFVNFVPAILLTSDWTDGMRLKAEALETSTVLGMKFPEHEASNSIPPHVRIPLRAPAELSTHQRLPCQFGFGPYWSNTNNAVYES